MQHIIRKQTIQLQLNRKADAFQMQHLMSSHYWHSVVPALEKLFDEVCPEGEIIYVEKLEIDLGLLTEKELYGQQWSDALLFKMAEQIYEKLSAGAAGAKATVQLQKESAGLVQQWLYYMQHGYLHWNTLQIDGGWKQQVLEALAQDEANINVLRKLLLSEQGFLRRVTEQHTDKFLLQLAAILSTPSHPPLPSLLQELKRVFKASSDFQTDLRSLNEPGIRPRLWSYILAIAAAPPQNADATTVVRSILKEDPFPGEEEAKGAEGEVEEDGIFVQHAGMVLLHPFLTMFFSRLGLTEEGVFTNSAAQQKALYLLHYVSTGETTAEEYELVFPKVLCAYPLQKPVSKQISLLKEETEEADQLLQEVIRQWEVLKSTSPPGLQETFLQRNGKLFTQNESLHLQVETSAVDVLLDYLPWNRSIIKLPWMKELLHVEWR
ncbi:contractile injection system tape measure protein [Pontibacter pamirensis]|uniref:contractile injection system tape measure protein n=1 Tax=Pontibacter pamirensis TaxID=2562824 RepID=UPI001389EE51|nr:contractile injection system tape measure protein [Pontibacter pamirensis]